jgi:hypothetical protein
LLHAAPAPSAFHPISILHAIRVIASIAGSLLPQRDPPSLVWSQRGGGMVKLESSKYFTDREIYSFTPKLIHKKNTWQASREILLRFDGLTMLLRFANWRKGSALTVRRMGCAGRGGGEGKERKCNVQPDTARCCRGCCVERIQREDHKSAGRSK